ncbi:hypothetical protein [Nocardia wallacei]|uniref:hypothetical protein n=1 Tax=Nocardia wallacei TaxID=480035 RepID=UPI002456C9D5|nr:hypothetical protein [Nocardia wallacei]
MARPAVLDGVIYSPSHVLVLHTLASTRTGHTARELAEATCQQRVAPVLPVVRTLGDRGLAQRQRRRTRQGATDWVWSLTEHGRQARARLADNRSRETGAAHGRGK